MFDDTEGSGPGPSDRPAHPASGNGAIPFATKDQILAARSRPRRIEKIHIKAWGGDCYFIQLTGREKDAWEKSLVKGEGRKQRQDYDNVRARLIALTMIDPNTQQRIFTSSDEVLMLGELDAESIDEAFSLTAALNKVTRDDVEDLAGNSGRDRAGI